MLMGGKVIPIDDIRRDSSGAQNLTDARPVLRRGDGKVGNLIFTDRRVVAFKKPHTLPLLSESVHAVQTALAGSG